MTELEASPELPVPAPLASLDPVTRPFGGIESLDSYAYRVAAAHRVPRFQIDWHVMGKLEFRQHLKSSGQLSVDSPSPTARTYAARLAGLTGRPDVAALGLSCFTGLFGVHGARVANRLWCCSCHADNHRIGRPAYWPLVWSLPGYEVCHRHHVWLRSKCYCGATFSVRANWTAPLDACLTCGREFRLDDVSDQTAYCSYRHFASFALAGLAMSAYGIHCHQLSVRLNFDRLLAFCVRSGRGTTFGELARKARLSAGTAHMMRHPEARLPSLDVLVRLSAAFRVSLAGLVCDTFWKEKVNVPGLKLPIALPRPPLRRRHDWQLLAAKALEESRTEQLSITRLATRWDISEQSLRRRLGPVAERIAEAAWEYRLKQKGERVEDLQKRIPAAISELTAAGATPSQRNVARHLDVMRQSPEFRRAWNIVMNVPDGFDVDVHSLVTAARAGIP